MPFKNPPTKEQLARIASNKKERNVRYNARQKLNQIVESSRPEELNDNIQAWLFHMGTTIQKGDIRQMWINFTKYKEVCANLGQPTMPLTVFMLMGLSVEEIRAILQGKLYANHPEVREMVRKILNFVLADIEQAHIRGEMPTTTLIWYQKNFAYMSDFPDNSPVEMEEDDSITGSELAEKYKDIID